MSHRNPFEEALKKRRGNYRVLPENPITLEPVKDPEPDDLEDYED